jgi:ubiquinone/menaquinone biosynthesis C-methylase UbiE
MNDKDYKRYIRGAFDQASAGYDHRILRFFDNSARRLARMLPLKGGELLLDAASGTGKVALAVAERLKGGHVTGVDLSSGMLARAGRKAKRAGLRNVSFLNADLDTVPFPPGYFDGVTCGFGVFFWKDMQKGLSRLAGLVKKGGFVAFSAFADGSFDPHADMCLKRFEAYGVKLPKSYAWRKLDHPAKIKKLLHSVGLRNVVCKQFQAGYPVHPQDWWHIIRFSGFRAFLNQLTPEQAARYKREFLKDVAATAKAGKVFLDVRVITASATK